MCIRDRGTIDLSDPSGSKSAFDQIKSINGNDELNGDKIIVNATDNLGYGYIGLNANTINVGGEPGSDASKNLRKALTTVLAVYRDVAIDSYYGDAASVINYPISNTSWAAPQKSDADYQVAYSVDVDGNPLYTEMCIRDRNKATGGYMTELPDYGVPFIFANFNGTSGDVDVITHECGPVSYTHLKTRSSKPEELVLPCL